MVNSTRFQLRFNSDKDRDVIEALNEQENMVDYIRRLIRSDVGMRKIIDVYMESQEEKNHENL